MNLSLTGLPAFIFLVGFVVVFSTPVWLAARMVGARYPTLLRAAASLGVGVLGAFALAFLIGPWVFLFAPVIFLLAFKYILGTTLLGAVLLAVIAGLGYVAMGYLFGGMMSPDNSVVI
jgi:hypothetical protein